MNKKLLIIGIVTTILLAAGVGVSLYFLYSDKAIFEDQKLLSVLKTESKYSLVAAVPSDAVAACRFETLQGLEDVINSPAFSANLKKPTVRDFYDFCAQAPEGLASSQALVSLHYGSYLCPLLVVDAGKSSDTPSEEASALIAQAKRYNLAAEYVACEGKCSREYLLSRKAIVLISPQDNIIKSAQRHIIVGESIAANEGFIALAAMNTNQNWFFVQNAAFGKILKNVLPSRFNREVEFFKKSATWTNFSLLTLGESSAQIAGAISAIKGNNNEYFDIFKNIPAAADANALKAIPASATFAYGLTVKSYVDYTREYFDWADYKGYYNDIILAQNAFRKKVGLPFDVVANALGLNEIAYAQTANAKVLVYPVSKADAKVLGQPTVDKGQVYAFPLAGLARCIFGNAFSLTPRKDEKISSAGEVSFAYVNGCLVVSDSANLGRYLAALEAEGPLSESLAAASDMHNLHYWAYRAPSAGQSLVVYSTKPGNRFAGEYTSGTPIVKQPKKTFRRGSRNAPQVEVPIGPWQVKNSGTGKLNSLSQNQASYEITLTDENGKALWTSPVPGKIAGKVGQVDMFKNGKIQYLFCIGSKLYLYDRLGRPVEGFPVELGQNVVLGPDVYDFNSNRKYNILVLLEDGSIQMFNLKGEKPASWKGIAPGEEVFSALPSPVKADGKTVWNVPAFSGKVLKYAFEGGEPIE